MSKYLQYFNNSLTNYQPNFTKKKLKMWGLIISFEQKKPAQNWVAGYWDIKKLLSRGDACDKDLSLPQVIHVESTRIHGFHGQSMVFFLAVDTLKFGFQSMDCPRRIHMELWIYSISVRGTSPCPPTRPRLAPHVPATRPVDPPNVPPNLRRPVGPRRW